MTITLEQPAARVRLPLNDYDRVIVSFSGGKDSIACVLALLDAGVDRDRLELWHQYVDGEDHGERGLMDWPCTASYCQAFADHLGLPLLFQWRHGGFEGEMLRDNQPTGRVSYQTLDGQIVTCPDASRVRLGTRQQFPQVSADLSVRWCSSYCKIDVAARAMRNDPRFKSGTFMFITGERREESTARAKYAEFEPHRADGLKRRVDHYRNVIDLSEGDVWEIMRRYGIVPHPAYRLGWGRVSCLACIFGNNDQWASVRDIAPTRFNRIAAYEQQFGKTIHRSLNVIQRAEKGTSYLAGADPSLVALAMGREYPRDQIVVPAALWTLPAGAYRHCGGPT